MILFKSMPNLDGTGPMGKGPMTGRRQGRCGNASRDNDENTSVNKSDAFGGRNFGRGVENGRARGIGRGRGLGRGLGRQ